MDPHLRPLPDPLLPSHPPLARSTPPPHPFHAHSPITRSTLWPAPPLTRPVCRPDRGRAGPGKPEARGPWPGSSPCRSPAEPTAWLRSTWMASSKWSSSLLCGGSNNQAAVLLGQFWGCFGWEGGVEAHAGQCSRITPTGLRSKHPTRCSIARDLLLLLLLIGWPYP